MPTGCAPRCSAPTTASCRRRASCSASPASGASGAAILTAGIAGLVAGALSMAAGEYVSVSSQRDAEQADLRLEARELRRDPRGRAARAGRDLRAARPAAGAGAARWPSPVARATRWRPTPGTSSGLDERAAGAPAPGRLDVGAVVLGGRGAAPGWRPRLAPAGARVGAISGRDAAWPSALLGDLGARLGGAPRSAPRPRCGSSPGAPWPWRSRAGIGALVGTVT